MSLNDTGVGGERNCIRSTLANQDDDTRENFWQRKKKRREERKARRGKARRSVEVSLLPFTRQALEEGECSWRKSPLQLDCFHLAWPCVLACSPEIDPRRNLPTAPGD